MRVAFPYNHWQGGFLDSISRAFRELGHVTLSCSKHKSSFLTKALKRVPIGWISTQTKQHIEREFNQGLLGEVVSFKPDMFVNMSGGGLYPETVKAIKQKTNCVTICIVFDDPCNPAPQRDKYFPMTLRYYDILLLPEPSWAKIIKNLTPSSKIIPFFGGYDPELFFPVSADEISDTDRIRFGADVSFTGYSYGQSAEGGYRAGILAGLDGYDLKIWGDNGWRYRFRFFPGLERAYQGARLSYSDIRKLYRVSKINLNVPSPQIFRSFQPRVFEIAAAKGFQLIDYSEELGRLVGENNTVMFRDLHDLREKVSHYLANEKEREILTNDLHEKIKERFTWKNQIRITLDQL
jgi:Glycosyl transferases group 1